MTEPESSSRDPARTWPDNRWLLVIAAVALVIRLLWLWTHGAVIENEGAAYARLAENVFAGNDYVSNTGGRNTIFPPLYPIAIGLVAFVVGNAELAARLVSLVSGVALIWPVYGITRYLGGRRCALIAACLAAASGVLVALSGSAYSESSYLLLLTAAIYFTCRVFESGALRDALEAGVIFGAAYLIRPEAVVFAGLAILFVIGNAMVARKGRRQTMLVIASIGVSAALLATPYVAWLSVNSGYFRWEGKSLINGLTGDRMSQGMTYQEAAYGLGPNMEPHGPYLVDQFDLVAYDRSGIALALSTVLTDPAPRLVDIAREFASPSGAGGPILALLAVIGLLTALLVRAHRVQKLYLAAAGVAYVVILLSLQHRWDRFVFPLMLLALPWAANGISVIGIAAGRLADGRPAGAAWRRAVVTSVAVVGIALMSLLSFRYAGALGEFTQSGATDMKAAGLWLRDRQPATVMGMGGVVPYYAKASLVYLPYTDAQSALRYIHGQQPDFIYLRNGDEPQNAYIADWLASGIPDTCAVPVHSVPQPNGGQLTIYEWTCP